MNAKERIKERVNEINDPRLLNELLKVVELEHEIEHIDESIDIEISEQQEQNGQVLTQSEVEQHSKEWLK